MVNGQDQMVYYTGIDGGNRPDNNHYISWPDALNINRYICIAWTNIDWLDLLINKDIS